MPTSPSIHRCMPLSQSSANNSLELSKGFKKSYDKKAENDERKSLKRDLRRSHSFFRKNVQQSIVIHTQKNNRRRYTFSGSQDNKILKKRRRLSSIAWPFKFLLGGSRTDPLNLRSLEDETINEQLNAFSPASSPTPIPARRSQVQVFIPPNIYDPLNLNSGEEIELNILKARKRQRHRKSRKEEHENQLEIKFPCPEKFPSSKLISKSEDTSPSIKDIIQNDLSENKKEIISGDSLCNVSSKHSVIGLNIISKSFSITEKEENTSDQKKFLKRRRSKSRVQRNDTIKFRANAEKFCYGNHIISQSHWTFDGSACDPRVTYFSLNMFEGRDVLDIGCNTGKLTLLVSKVFHPRRVTGIDIDKKLIRIAERNLRFAHRNFICRDMPQSMHLLYGPLAKVMLLKRGNIIEYPDNVTFLEANYVPPSEDYLETQRPEYDTILCLRVTKWIHLNFGDRGLQLAFKRMFAQLRFGGKLILEPQPWFTYSASKRITPAIYKTYRSLLMRPESFCDYLLSSEVGFSSCDIIGRSTNYAKGYRQNIYLLTKNLSTEEILINNLSPVIYNSDQWSQDSDENYEGITDYMDAESEYSKANVQTQSSEDLSST